MRLACATIHGTKFFKAKAFSVCHSTARKEGDGVAASGRAALILYRESDVFFKVPGIFSFASEGFRSG